MRRLAWFALVVAISTWAVPVTSAGVVTVEDVGLTSGFQDLFLGHHKRGRASIAADFDLDGWTDLYVGNPGDESLVLRNTTGATGSLSFELVEVLLDSDVAWAASAADYDDDGDYDLYVSIGGNEGIGHDFLFRNDWLESGETQLSFTDVSGAAGIRGPVPPSSSSPIEIASANGVWADYDRDGDVDLFVSGNINTMSLPTLQGRNTMWRNDGDGTFTDVTEDVRLADTRYATRHSTFLDIDNDGDVDLFESNYGYPNVLWRNTLVETGSAVFEDVTALFSPGTEDLSFPIGAFASAVADFNNDGWQDIMVFARTGTNPESGSPYPIGHAIFENLGGAGFEYVSHRTGLNDTYQVSRGVMGCQVGDVNGDGVPDLFVGNGDPPTGTVNQLYLSDSAVGVTPHFIDRTDLIDFPAAEDPLGQPYPPYPYRTHGSAIVDLDNDGLAELVVANGGPWFAPDDRREPNRLYRFDVTPRPHYLKVRPVGDGTRVSLDAIGTRFAVSVRRGTGPVWTIYKTLCAGSAFSAQNGFEVHFGLGDADTVESLDVTWPDGHRETLTRDLVIDTSIVVMRDPVAGAIPPTLMLAERGGELELVWQESCASTDYDYSLYAGRIDDGFTGYAVNSCSTAGLESRRVPMPIESTYFLVVPRNLQVEGSYGGWSDLTERPPAATPCMPQSVGCTGR